MQETITVVLNAQPQTQGIQTFVGALGNAKTAIEGLAGGVSRFVRTAASFAAPLLAAVSGGAMLRGLQTSIQLADALAKSAQSAGMAAKEFSVLNYAAGLSNVSSEQLVTASKGLSEWLGKTGQSGRELSAVLLEQADVFAAMADGPEKVRLATDRFGKSGLSLIPFLNQGSAAIREQMAEAEELGLAIGPRFGAMAQQFSDNISRVKSFVQGVFNGVAQAFLPLLVEITERVVAWAKANAQRIGAFVSDAVGVSTEAFRQGRFGELVGVLIEAGVEQGFSKGMSLAAAVIKAGLERIFGPGFLILAAQAGKALAQSLMMAAKVPVDFLTSAFEWLVQGIYNAFVATFNKLGTILGDILSGTFNTIVEGLNKIRIFGEFAPMKFTVAPEVQVDRSFGDIFKQSQGQSAEAIGATTKYFDEQIARTREALTTGVMTDAPVPTASERAAAFFEQMRAGLAQREAAAVPEAPDASQATVLRATITAQELQTNREIFEQRKKILDLEVQRLSTRGLVDEQTGRTIGTITQESDAIEQQLLKMRELVAERERYNRSAMEAGDPDAQLAARKQELDLARERLEVERQLLSLREQTNDYSFVDRFNQGMQAMADEVHNFGAAVADVMVGGVRNAIQSVSQGMWQVVDGTASWGQIFQQVGRQIISNLTEILIQELFVDQIRRGIAVAWKGFKSALGWGEVAESAAQKQAEVAAHAAGEAEKTGFTLGGAMARGISRVGETLLELVQWPIRLAAHLAGEAGKTAITAAQAAIRIGWTVIEAGKELILAAFKAMSAVAKIPYVGPILALAALAAIVGAGVAVASKFEKGGIVHGGRQMIEVNENGTEAVLNARATAMLGEERIAMLNAGILGALDMENRIAGNFAIPSTQPPQSAGGETNEDARPVSVNIMLVDSRNSAAAREFIESSAGRLAIAEIVRDQKTEIGLS